MPPDFGCTGGAFPGFAGVVGVAVAASDFAGSTVFAAGAALFSPGRATVGRFFSTTTVFERP